MSNQQIQNAQHYLQQLRERDGVNGRQSRTRSIATVAQTYRPGNTPNTPPEPPKQPHSGYMVTSLDSFKYDHLNEPQRRILQTAVNKTRQWLAEYKQSPGLSAIYAGPVGTGKTTMAENIITQFKQTISASISIDDDFAYYNAIMTGQRPSVPAEQIAIEYSRARLLRATQLMAIMEDSDPRAIASAFSRDDLIVIDDVGTEEIPYQGRQYEATRQSRYHTFFDFATRTNKHVILTTNIPLYNGKGYNDQFIDTLGQAAFSRLFGKSANYHIDTTGLPDFRPLVGGR